MPDFGFGMPFQVSGFTSLNSGSSPQTRELWKELATVEPESPRAQQLMAQISMTGNSSDLTQLANRNIQQANQASQNRNVSLQLSRSSQTQALWKELAQTEPESPRAQQLMAQISMSGNSMDLAQLANRNIQQANQASQNRYAMLQLLDPKSPEYNYLSARLTNQPGGNNQIWIQA